MDDSFSRKIDYMRICVTNRCTLHCPYCKGGVDSCHDDVLSADDIVAIVEAGALLGVKKVRLTGGEPLLRADLPDIIARVRNVPGIRELALTTNGQALEGCARELKRAGLDRINISLDTLRQDRYIKMTGGDIFKVLRGIDAALCERLTPVKLNAVLMHGINDDEFLDFLSFARFCPVDVRFIELMPMNIMGAERGASLRVPTDELLKRQNVLLPIDRRDTHQSAMEYTMEGAQGRIGFISPLTHRFCAQCNRIRITCDGAVRPCLGSNIEIPIIEHIKTGNIGAIKEQLERAVMLKPREHTFSTRFSPSRPMNEIGG